MSLGRQEIINSIGQYDGPAVKIMEVCGTHTASIFKSGIRSILPPEILLISGPGCPVCVTSAGYIDKAIEYALKKDHMLVTFGDMMKVKGTQESLSEAKGRGAHTRLMYSPAEIIKKAEESPHITFVVAAVGFETTAPSYALLVNDLIEKNIKNVKLLTGIKTVIPALDWICREEKAISAFICPGHVSTVIGSNAYAELAEKYKKPFVVTGFEAEHILAAVYDIIFQLAQKRGEVHNLYKNAVNENGNEKARLLLDTFFEKGDAQWRGIGIIKDSGLYLKPEYSEFEAGGRELTTDPVQQSGCRCSDVIIGRILPSECPMFADACTPQTPYGPCMVSGEGACGIWYQNR